MGDAFEEALRHLDRLRDRATQLMNRPQLVADSAIKEASLEDIVRLRHGAREAMNASLVIDERFDKIGQDEVAASAVLSSLQSRIATIDERIKASERALEELNRRTTLEEANGRLAEAKDRIKIKQELLKEREKKLKEFQHTLGPALKLGNANAISEFDDGERVDAAFRQLPRPLQYLYGQMRNAKASFRLPIEIWITLLPKISSQRDHDMTPLGESHVSAKKPRWNERKLKHGQDEKRRKRWYETVAGKDAIPYDDWLAPQRAISIASIYAHPVRPKALPRTVQRNALLLDLSDSIREWHRSVKHPKRKKQRPFVVHSEPETNVPAEFPLPIPKGELCVEIRFFDGENPLAVLAFSVHANQVFVASSPDRMLSKTIQYSDDVSRQRELRNTFQSSLKAMTSAYGFPFNWAQELCGIEILKPCFETDELSDEQLKEMNRAMIRQQETIANFVNRVRTQAMDLITFKLGIRNLKEIANGSGEGNRTVECVQFNRTSSERIGNRSNTAVSSKSEKGFATGTWMVVMKRAVMENGVSEEAEKDPNKMEVDNPLPKRLIRMRFFPHVSNEWTKRMGVEKSELFYEAVEPEFDSLLKMKRFIHLETDENLPLVLIGPLKSEDIRESDDLVFGKLIVQKRIEIPKKFVGILPADFEARFFPFELRSKKHDFHIDLKMPLQKELYRIYRVKLRMDCIQLTALIQVHLLNPLFPTVSIESVIASSDFKKKVEEEAFKEPKAKTASDGKNKTEHIKMERERIMKKEIETMKLRELAENVMSQLEKLNPDALPSVKDKKLPTFCCEDARKWISRQVRDLRGQSPEEAVRKLESAFEEWCTTHQKGVKALNGFLENGNSKSKKRDSNTKHKRNNKTPKETRKTDVPADAKHHEEELEQGEIPSVPKTKSTSKTRPLDRRTLRTSSYTPLNRKPHQRNRSPISSRVSLDRSVRYTPRTPMRSGNSRLDSDASRDRSKGPNALNRVRR